MALTNTQYESILREYGRRQLQGRRVLQEHRRYVETHLPEYVGLEEKAAQISVFYGRQLLSGEENALATLKEELAALSAQKKQLLTQAGLGEDYLRAPCVCADCHDTGFVGNEKCHCFRQQEVRMLFESSGLMDLQNCGGFSSVSDEYYEGEDLTRFRNAFEKAQTFVARFDTEPSNLLFFGTVGTGKSFLSACIAKELLSSGYAVLYFSAVTLFRLMADAAFHRETPETDGLMEHLFTADLLIIDDLGCEVTNRLTFSQLFTCLNERVLRQKSTIISTNLSLDEIKERYSDRIFSRLLEQYDLFRFSGPDIRIYKKMNA